MEYGVYKVTTISHKYSYSNGENIFKMEHDFLTSIESKCKQKSYLSFLIFSAFHTNGEKTN